MDRTKHLQALGQSLWLDAISRTMIDDGTLRRYIETYSITGLTSNPTIFEQALRAGAAYDRSIREKNSANKADGDLFVELALEDLRRAADLLRPAFDASDGVDGWVSMELSPLLADDAQASIEAAARIHRQAARPNLFIKIPGTPAGCIAIEESIFAGVPINVTLLFSREQYVAAAEAYLRGIERRIAAGLPPRVASVASMFVSRWDKAVHAKVPQELHNQLGIAVAGRTYRAYRDVLISARWAALRADGARAQRLLWASTGTKDPNARDTLYVEALAAPGTIDTMPEATLHAFADHGAIERTMAEDGGDTEPVFARFAAHGIDVDALAADLQREGAEAFTKSWRLLLATIASKRSAIAGADQRELRR